MNQDLYLHESILLLGLDDEKGNFTSSISYVNYGFASALLMDLVLEERISIEDKKVLVKTNAITDNKLLNKILHKIQEAKKPKKVSKWIHDLVNSNRKNIDRAIDKLIRNKILEKKKKKILWLFNVSRYPTVNVQSENQLRERLREIIFRDAEPNQKELMLITILKACRMEKDLIPDKQERKLAKGRIKTLTEDSELKKLVGGAVEEMEVLVTVITTASI